MLKAVGQALFSSGLQTPKYTAQNSQVSVSPPHHLIWQDSKPIAY